MQKMLKRGLLRFGGYTVAQRIHVLNEHRKLTQSVRKFLDTGSTPLPDMVMFEPTQRCNLRCKMCYQDRSLLANRGELTLEQIIDFFSLNPYLQKVTLIGGEIFIRPDMIDLIQYLDRTRDIVISTNGTLIGESEIDVLRRCRRIFTVCISLDGPKTVHEAIRGVRGSYDKTVHTIKTLAKVLPITVTCVITEDNIAVLPDVVGLCADLGVKKLNFELERIYLEDGISQAMNETSLRSEDLPISTRDGVRGYSLETFRNTLDECKSRGEKDGIYVTFDPPFLMDDIETCYSGSLRSKHKYICQSFRMATIAPNGDLINCFAIRKPFGNILDAPFDEIWNSEAAKAYRGQLVSNNLTPLCENCTFMRPYHKSLLVEK